MIYQIKENMSYQNIKVMEKEDLHLDLENHLLINLANKQKVKIYLNIAPGPGTYRSPSDFGQYD